MMHHPDYNLALRLAGFLFQLLLVIVPTAASLCLLVSAFVPTWPVQLWLTPLLQWSVIMGAIAALVLFIGSLWDSL